MIIKSIAYAVFELITKVNTKVLGFAISHKDPRIFLIISHTIIIILLSLIKLNLIWGIFCRVVDLVHVVGNCCPLIRELDASL